jgi:signal transduction histidine kinase
VGLLLALGAALLVTYAWVVPRLVLSTEDRIFGAQLDVLRVRAEARLEALGGSPGLVELAPGARLLTEPGALGAEAAAWLRGLAPGLHEFNDEPLPGGVGSELMVVVEPATAERGPWWLLYDVGPFEALEGPWSALYLLAIGGGAFVALGATILGLGLARGLFRALRDLSELVGQEAEVAPAGASRAERRDDEIGEIARAWRTAVQRSGAALDRERRFTRDASHELRTPVAAARAALELLQAESAAAPERRAELIGRMDRALVDMGDLVEAFLWLARETETRPEGLDEEGFRVDEPARAAIDRQGEPERFELRAEDACWVPGPETIARFLIASLLGNALAHGDGGLIEVEVRGRSIAIRNGIGPSGDSSGFGFGLGIIDDLCARLGWACERTAEPERYVAELEFQKDQRPPRKTPKLS